MGEIEIHDDVKVKAREIRGYGWKPSLPDHRDHKFSQMHPIKFFLPESVDLRSQDTPVYDQGDLGSCTAHASAGMAAFVRKKLGLPQFIPSRLWIYYNERVIEGTVDQDAGAELRSAMQVISTLGEPHESLWWYNTPKFAVKPSKNVYTDALKHKAMQYMSLNQDLTELRTCLSDGYPFMLGFVAYPGLESDAVAKSGNLPMPGAKEAPIGGHAVLCVGYNDVTRMFLIRNSWGPNWALKGYFNMPYDYVLNSDLTSDLWTMRSST